MLYSASLCAIVATMSVASQPVTERMTSPAATSTTSAMPEAMAMYPILTALAPEAGPFSTSSAGQGSMSILLTRAEATAVSLLKRPPAMLPTKTWSTSLRRLRPPASLNAALAE